MGSVIDAIMNSTGQQRRAWLDGKAQKALDWVGYYAGPHLMPAIESGLQIGASVMPSADLMDMAEGSRDLMGGDYMGGAAMMAGGLDSALIPGNYSGIRSAVDDAGELASRSAKLYNFPTRSEVGDALGRSDSGGLDLEGRPLFARYVVGGAPGRAVEQSLPPEALDEIAEGLTGVGVQKVPRALLPRGAQGAYAWIEDTDKPWLVKVAKGLDPETTTDVRRHEAQVCNLLMELQESLELAYLFISHDMAVVERVSHRVAVMFMGEVVEIGPRQAIFAAPRHPYTRKLISAVPVPDPARRHLRRGQETEEPRTPFRPAGYVPPERNWQEVGPGHFVQMAAG